MLLGQGWQKHVNGMIDVELVSTLCTDARPAPGYPFMTDVRGIGSATEADLVKPSTPMGLSTHDIRMATKLDSFAPGNRNFSQSHATHRLYRDAIVSFPSDHPSQNAG
jgi:hypothetical protein